MQVSSSQSLAVPSAGASAAGGSSAAAEIARLQKQIRVLTNDLKDVATDDSLDAKAKQKKAALLQAQIQVLQQQIAAIQQAEAQKSQDRAQHRTQAAQEADPAPSPLRRQRSEGRPGSLVDVLA